MPRGLKDKDSRGASLASLGARLADPYDDDATIIPPYEGKLVPTSLRVPEYLLERIDRIAKDTKHSRSDVILFILRWGCSAVEAKRAKDELDRSSKK